MSERRKLVQDYMDEERRPMNHMRDFLDCVKSRRQPVANAEVAHRSMTTCHAINAAMLMKRNLKWDPEREEFVGVQEANRFLSRAMRAPWRV